MMQYTIAKHEIGYYTILWLEPLINLSLYALRFHQVYDLGKTPRTNLMSPSIKGKLPI